MFRADPLLLCAFDLIGAALPLAIERLRTTGVPVRDQHEFWFYFLALEKALEKPVFDVMPDYEELMTTYLNDPGEQVPRTFYDLAAEIRRNNDA